MHVFSAKPSVVRVSPKELTCEIPAGRNFHSSPLTRACSIAAEMKDNAHSPEAEDNDRKLCIMIFFLTPAKRVEETEQSRVVISGEDRLEICR